MLQVKANITENIEAKLYVEEIPSLTEATLKPNEVVIRVEAAPVNPSDLALLVPPGSDAEALSKIKTIDDGLSFPISKKFAKYLAPRINKPVPTGSEGAGIVVKAGSSKEAQALMNKVVSVAGPRGTYSQYIKASLSTVLPHLEGTTPEEAASSFVNPVTAVCIVDNVRSGGHKAFIHTAAASQLGVMLVKYCQEEKVPVVNVVRKESQEKSLKALGAKYIVRSDKDTFMADLIKAVHETKATCAFDAIGGGDMANKLLLAMEQAAKLDTKVDPASFYGTNVYKQVYVYGGLDRSPTMLMRGFGMSWGINGWLMPNYLGNLDLEKRKQILGSVAQNIKTIFKTEYFERVSLRELVDPKHFLQMSKQETGKKFLVLPQKDLIAKI